MAICITASMLYDVLACPHRVWRDLFADRSERNPVSPFCQLLWEKGNLHEAKLVANLNIPFVNLFGFGDHEREAKTLESMAARETLIYHGRIRYDDLLGEPDLLRREGDRYVAVDIKCAAAEEGAQHDGNDGKPKKHYAVQLALYTDLLERLGCSAGRYGFIWDIDGEETKYDLTLKPGPRSPVLWDTYIETLSFVREIVSNQNPTLPALGAICNFCHWRVVCRKQLDDSNDLSLIPELGRARRDSFLAHIQTLNELAQFDISSLIQKGDKTSVPSVGAGMLQKFHKRAILLSTPDSQPYLTAAFVPCSSKTEIFFDIEDDPFSGVCYMHGFLERQDCDCGTEKYHSFVAPLTQDGEESAFQQAVAYMRERSEAVVYYYSHHERTKWRALQKRYPHVITEDEIHAIFSPPRSVDLYGDVVRPSSEWPTNNHSLKTLATYLEFAWRDTDPSGAASIEWYDQWGKSQDPKVLQRIIEYNEDDCRATRVLLDKLRTLPVIS